MFRNYLDKIERDEDVRKNLIELRKLLKTEPGSAAWQRDRQRCLSLMLKLLKHEDAKVRKNAALILGEMDVRMHWMPCFMLMNVRRSFL